MENLSIQAVSKIVGITPFTLRAWERRYRILKPKRSENGRRTYSLSDVEKLRLISALKKAGHSISQISQLSIKELTQLLDNTSEGPFGTKQVFIRPLAPSAQIENLLRSIRAIDIDQLSGQLKMLQLQLDTKSFLLEVIVPVLRIIGTEVATGKLEIFHEHAVSAMLKHLLGGILYATERSTDFTNQTPIIFATPENDHHEFGALVAAILAMVNGYRVFYLGPNMPAESLAKAAHSLQSPLVVMACAAPAETLSQEKFRRYYLSLIRQLPETTSLWMGGARTSELQRLSKWFRHDDLILKSLEEFDRILRLKVQKET